MASDVEIIFTPWPFDAVDRGVALLDEKVPGWRELIQVSRLAMSNGCRCVLGQLFGGYLEGVDALGPELPSISEDAAYGFDIPRPYPPYTLKPEPYAKLDTAWREAIEGGQA
jgi:hypothetical protein